MPAVIPPLLRLSLILATVAGAAIAAPRPAAAQEAGVPQDDEVERPRPHGSYVSVSFLGGALFPIGSSQTTLQNGLASGVRIGWTSRIGIGVDLKASYSPLAKAPEDGASYQTHYLDLGLMPRFTLGHGTVRLSLAAGGGAAYERTTVTTDTAERSLSRWAPAAAGWAAVELHLLEGGGIFAGGSYTRLFGGGNYQYAEAVGGLIFTF
jgi:hypothetical protein